MAILDCHGGEYCDAHASYRHATLRCCQFIRRWPGPSSVCSSEVYTTVLMSPTPALPCPALPCAALPGWLDRRSGTLPTLMVATLRAGAPASCCKPATVLV